jgi:hypothetical protein
MTTEQAIEILAAEQGVDQAEARARLVAAAEQLDQDGEGYTVEDCLNLARDFYGEGGR